jgi:AraC-like DNA-binding protein
MARDLGNLAVGLPLRPAGIHVLALDRELAIEDCVCHLHARSPTVERTHPRVAIAVILGGAFHVVGAEGEALVGPGALLLKNAHATHEYRHVDDGGDRSLTFELDEPLLEDAQASLGVARRRRRAFERVAIPPSPSTAATVAVAAHALASGDPSALYDAALAIAGLAFTLEWQPARRPVTPTPAQARRVARVLRYVDAHPAADASLATLAALAGLSNFHFARIFHAIVGQTPRRYVIAARLRAAAAALSTTYKPVLEIALDAGFGDLSHFTTTFRRAFGASPGRYRARLRHGR